jgi:hypothetical protein
MKKNLIIAIFLISISTLLTAQSNDFEEQCLTDVTDFQIPPFLNKSVMESKNGHLIYPHGDLHVLIVFVEIDYDLTIDPLPGGNAIWPEGELPDYKDQILDSVWSTNPQSELSKYYYESSFGNFRVTGDYLDTIITLTQSLMLTGPEGAASSAAAEITSRGLNSFITHNNTPIEGFDNLTAKFIGYPVVAQPDSSIDCIFYIFRNHHGMGNNSGFARSDVPGMLGYGGAPGTIQNAGTSFPQVLDHEFNHLIFGGGNFHGTGSNTGGGLTFFSPQGGWGMMGGSNSSFLTCNAWDRERLDWKGPQKMYTISVGDSIGGNEIEADLDAAVPGDAGDYIIRDFISTGDAIRIKLPHLPSNEVSQYIWIENHQTGSFNNSEFDVFKYQHHSCIENAPPGIYMYMQAGKDILDGTDTYSQDGHYIRPILADGLHDITLPDSITFPGCVAPSSITLPFDKKNINENPLTGSHDMEQTRIDLSASSNTSRINYQRYSEKIGNSYEHDIPMLGQIRHAFSVSGVKKINFGTNPSTNSMITRQTFGANQGPFFDNNEKVRLNGVAIEIVEEFYDGRIHVKVKFDDFDINNDIRWCGDVILEADSLNLKAGNTILLDQGATAQSDFQHLVSANNYLFVKPSLLTLTAGTVTTIDAGSELNVTNGSSLHIKSGATVIVRGNGKINISSNSFICIEAGANIILQDVDSELNIEYGASIGLNSLLNVTTTVCTEVCDIQNMNLDPSSNGLISFVLADAGADQIICPTLGSNTIGGNPTANTSIGTAPYTYVWSPVTDIDTSSISNPTITSVFTSDVTYSVTVTDANGCEDTDSLLLIFDPASTDSISSTGTGYCVNAGNDDGTATFTPGCGNPLNYVYLWDDIYAQTTQTATGLAAGQYSVLVTDTITGATFTDTVIVVADSLPFTYLENPVYTNSFNFISGENLKVKGELTVKTGAWLVITGSTIEFSYDSIEYFGNMHNRAIIIVEPGGKLSVESNSTLTGCGGGIWDGIEVWGSNGMPQTLTDSTQGEVYITGNSIVENAKIGVFAGKTLRNRDHTSPFADYGGIVKIYNTIFKNCNIAIALNTCGNVTSASYIRNSSFICDGGFGFSNSPSAFIRLTSIDMGAESIKENSFTVDPLVFSPLNRGAGITIKELNAYFSSNTYIKNNTFNNVTYGVDASTANSVRALQISHKNTFNSCTRGVYIKGFTGSIVFDNTFNVPDYPGENTYGVYMQESNMYKIENNTFNGAAGADKTVGLYINNSEVAHASQTNEVYGNNFNDLAYGSFGNGQNGDAQFSELGLTFKCNKYQNNNLDIITTVAPGISTAQGSLGGTSFAAGNEFVDGCGSITNGELWNQSPSGSVLSVNSYDYFYHPSPYYVPGPSCYTPLQVIPEDNGFVYNSDTSSTSGVGSCPNSDAPVFKTEAEIDEVRQTIKQHKVTIQTLSTTLDGGNSRTYITILKQQSLSNGQLKNQFIQNSPLSSDVLVALINSNYSSGTINEILLENSPLNYKVLLALVNKTPTLPNGVLKNVLEASAPLSLKLMEAVSALSIPRGIRNTIDQNQQNVRNPLSATQKIESEIGGVKRKSALLENEIIRSYMYLKEITDVVKFDEILMIIDSADTNTYRKTLAIEVLCRAKHTVDATQRIMELEQDGDANEFCSLQHAMMQMEAMPDKIMSINSDVVLKAQIETVANNTKAIGSIHARNLLEEAFRNKSNGIGSNNASKQLDETASKVTEEFVFPEIAIQTNKIVISPEIEEESTTINQTLNTQYQLTNYPNPFNESTTIKAVLPDDAISGDLVIHDLMGREIYRANLQVGTNSKVVNSTILQKGIYIYHIEVNDIIQLTEKLIKMK